MSEKSINFIGTKSLRDVPYIKPDDIPLMTSEMIARDIDCHFKKLSDMEWRKLLDAQKEWENTYWKNSFLPVR